MTTTPLKNCTLIVTRPTGQAEHLIAMLQKAGATALHFPVIEIHPIENQQNLIEQSRKLNTYDIAIFISRNAAIYGSKLLQKEGWPERTKIAAISSGTAQQLQTLDLPADIVSGTTADSEGLLSEAEMNSVQGKSILIIRGTGGREKLAETLRARGAHIDYFECYRRSCPPGDATVLRKLWGSDSLHGIILSSAEGIQNLYEMVDKSDLPRLNTTPLYVISTTMVELCGKLGYKLTPILMPSAHDEDVVKSVIAHSAEK